MLCLIAYIILFLTNPFYALFYFFINTFIIGVFIAAYQLEIFTGFLYVLEITVVFIMLILFFFFNFKGSWSFSLNEYISFWPICFFFIYSMPTVYSEEECLLPSLFRVWELWDDYYAALHQHLLNDFAGLYISYYLIHSLEFLIIGFILFIGSIGCISLYSIINTSKKVSYNLITNFLSLYTKLYDVLFLRRQTLSYQTHRQDSIRLVTRTINKGIKDLEEIYNKTNKPKSTKTNKPLN